MFLIQPVPREGQVPKIDFVMNCMKCPDVHRKINISSPTLISVEVRSIKKSFATNCMTIHTYAHFNRFSVLDPHPTFIETGGLKHGFHTIPTKKKLFGTRPPTPVAEVRNKIFYTDLHTSCNSYFLNNSLFFVLDTPSPSHRHGTGW